MRNQELNSDEASRIQIEIKALTNECDRITEKHENKMKEERKKEKKLIEKFLSF